MEYLFSTYYVLMLNSVLAFALLFLLKKGKGSQTAIAITGLIFFTWIGFLHWALGGKHIFPDDFSGTLYFAIILVGAISGVALLYFSPLKKIFFALPQDYLQMTQGLRVFVSAGFFMEAALGIIPLEFGIMDGFMHAASAFSALIAAALFAKKSALKNTALWIANIIGITDILVIVTCICFWVFDDLGPNHNMQYVVFFGGVLFLWIHFVSVLKLLQKKTEQVIA